MTDNIALRMSEQIFVDKEELPHVFHTVVDLAATDIFLSDGAEFFWAIDSVLVAGARSLAAAASGAELVCYNGANEAFRWPLSVLGDEAVTVNIIVPPRQPLYFVAKNIVGLKVMFIAHKAEGSEYVDFLNSPHAEHMRGEARLREIVFGEEPNLSPTVDDAWSAKWNDELQRDAVYCEGKHVLWVTERGDGEMLLQFIEPIVCSIVPFSVCLALYNRYSARRGLSLP